MTISESDARGPRNKRDRSGFFALALLSALLLVFALFVLKAYVWPHDHPRYEATVLSVSSSHNSLLVVLPDGSRVVAGPPPSSCLPNDVVIVEEQRVPLLGKPVYVVVEKVPTHQLRD